MQAVSRRRDARWWLLRGTAVGGLGLCLIGGPWLAERARVWALQQSLLAADPDHAAQYACGLFETGVGGVNFLADQLAGKRAPTADAAFEALSAGVSAWERQSAPPAEVAAALARRLSANMPRYGALTRLRASELALRLLLLPAPRGKNRWQTLTADCDAVLRTAAADRRKLQAPAQFPSGLAGRPVRPAPPMPARPVEVAEDPALPKASLASRPLPERALAGASTLQWEKPKRMGARATPLQEHDELDAGGDDGGAQARLAPPLTISALPSANRASDSDGDAYPGDDDGEGGLRRLSAIAEITAPIDVLAFLEGKEAAPADPRLLAVQGQPLPTEVALSNVERHIAERLPRLGVGQRLELLAALTSLPDVDAMAWLWAFTQDSYPDVRRRAFALLATSADPLVQQRLRAAAKGSRDEELTRIVEQLDRRSSRR